MTPYKVNWALALPTVTINQENIPHSNIKTNLIEAFAQLKVCQFGMKLAGIAPDHKFTINNKTPLAIRILELLLVCQNSKFRQ